MKILIDVNHPAHVHYFRNFIKLMEAKGHEFCVINRDSKMINLLLDYYGIEHTIRNKRPSYKGTLVSILNLIWMTLWCIRKSFSFRPDLYMGFGSAVCALSSRVFRKPCILLDDTEHNHINHRIYMPNCDAVLTPFYFKKRLGDGDKQFSFNAYVEQLYLHSEDYEQSNEIVKELNLEPGNFVVLRLIAYDAHHDLTIKHLSDSDRIKLVKTIVYKYKVVLSMEEGCGLDGLEDYIFKFPPERMHDLMVNAKLVVTEGATMASEAFVLGVPYLFIGSSTPLGNLDYQCKNYPDRAYRTIDIQDALNYLERLMSLKIYPKIEKDKLEMSTIRPTSYLEWFVENYPNSVKKIKENPEIQNQFK